MIPLTFTGDDDATDYAGKQKNTDSLEREKILARA